MPKVPIKSPGEVDQMRKAGRIVADVLKLIHSAVLPGVSAGYLDKLAEDFIRSQGGEPAFKGYGADRNNLFPASICLSIDDVVVHGIPDGRELRDGEIVSIDVGVKIGGFYGDGAATFAVGHISEGKSRLLKVTEEALARGIAQARPGNRVGDISAAVQLWVEERGFSVVRDLVGHGVGCSLHEEPAVPNFVEERGKNRGIKLRSGMTLAIEPMVNAGTERVKVDGDGWTVRTADGEPSAHFEHTVLVTEGEPEILTQ